jgi:hypothetical protein
MWHAAVVLLWLWEPLPTMPSKRERTVAPAHLLLLPLLNSTAGPVRVRCTLPGSRRHSVHQCERVTALLWR